MLEPEGTAIIEKITLFAAMHNDPFDLQLASVSYSYVLKHADFNNYCKLQKKKCLYARCDPVQEWQCESYFAI